MNKLWIENHDLSFVIHMSEPHLTAHDDRWHSEGSWWCSEWVALTILGRKNMPGPGQVAEVECEFKTFWEAEE